MNATREWLTTGTVIRNYRIEARIAASGTGEIYLAKELTSTREVALKVLPAPAQCKIEQMETLAQKMRKQAKVQSRFICETYEIGVTEKGKLFIASEYVNGQSLDTLMQARTELNTEEIAEQIAEALQAAHDAGRVHADLKFSNIMLTTDGDVKVLDFDMASYKQFCQHHTEEKDAMADAQPSSVRHFSPEHVHQMPLTEQSDLFSLGTMLYEMLTGTAAFTGATALKVCASILWNKPESAEKLAFKTSPALSVAVGNLLEKDQKQRTVSAQAFLVEMRPLLDVKASPVAKLKLAKQQAVLAGEVQMFADFGKGLFQYLCSDGAIFAFMTVAVVGGCYALTTFMSLMHVRH